MFGGMPMTDELATVYRERFGAEFIPGQVYAQSEATYITCPRPGEQAPWGSAGRRNDDFEVRIIDDDGDEVPDGEVGEIVCRPLRPHIMFDGYWGRPDATLAVMRDLWLHTGDLGKFDDEGWLHFADRKEDYLRRRGENISSQAVEEQPRITPRSLRPRFVLCRPISAKTTQSDDYPGRRCRGHVRRRSVQVVVRRVAVLRGAALHRVRDELPTTPTGKVLKRELREDGVTDATWDREKSDVPAPRR